MELGASASRKYDIEVFMPSRNEYGEVALHSPALTFHPFYSHLVIHELIVM